MISVKEKNKLSVNFFNKKTLKIAEDLLGKYIIRKYHGKKIIGRIVETEAYIGTDDLASHASKGRTKRTEIMFGCPGVAYIYLVYGMYYCFNIVTEKEDFPAAVLIRAVEPIGYKEVLRIEIEKLTNGPGKFCRFFKIDKDLNKENLALSKNIWIEDWGERINKIDRVKTARVGILYAKHCKDYLWRFYIRDNKFISRK